MDRVSSEHWNHVKQLFDSALERSQEERTEFLDQACAEDPRLRREVESLIKSHERAGSFLDSPAVESVAESLIGERLVPGQQVKHYQITALIGEGGMGEVYLAKDLILGRRVAIKLLPENLVNDPDRLRRFKQEARTASSLTHPNVCVIHEVGETEAGRPFIAMEYVEGATLRQRLNEGSLHLLESLDVAIQVADALHAAHDAGIVHRDIKPENIVVRGDGYIKVLDFGLAKLTEVKQRGAAKTASTLLFQSTPGIVMGTVGYMSPEQARGVMVDQRTDIWSLGVLLYEMVSGRPPFEGETPTDIVIAIVEKDPLGIASQFEQVPPELERIVKKALRKNADERYQLAKELAIDLRSLRKDLEVNLQFQQDSAGLRIAAAPTASGRSSESNEHDRTVTTRGLEATRVTAAASSSTRTRWPLGVALAALAIAVLAGTIWFLKRPARNPETPRFERINVTKLTTNGNAIMAALSPDGKYLAYVLNEGGKQSLWLRQVALPTNVQLLPPRDGRYLGVTFSPDGNFVYFGYLVNDGKDLGAPYRMPVLGVGNAATKVDLQNGPASLSHDGKQIAFIHYDHSNRGDVIKIASPDGTNEQEVARRQWPQRFAWGWETTPAWTKNDEALAIALVNSDTSGFFFSIFEIRLADKTERIVSLSSQRFAEPGDVELLSDGSAIMISAEAHGASFPQIWMLSRDGGVRSITNDLSDYRGLSLRTDASAFVSVQRQTLSKIWLLPKGETEKAKEVTSGTSRYFDLCWAPDGKIIYASDASGHADIYEMATDGVMTRQLTSDAKRNYAPSVSPDGRYVVFHSNRSGIFQIWRMNRDGTNPTQLTFAKSESNWPVFLPDGKWVIYQHFESGQLGTLWKVPIEGGSAIPLVNGPAIRPVVSPDGKLIAYWQHPGEPDSGWHLAISRLDGEPSLRTFEVSPTVQVQWDTLLRWSPDSLSVVYTSHQAGIDNLWAQRIDGGPARQITSFKEGRIFSFDWSSGGDLVASRGVLNSDVVLINDLGR